jgi:phosphatidylserine synthase
MPDQKSSPKYELEYKTLSENIRWWSNLRFAQLTLFVVVMAALFGTVNSTSSPVSGLVRIGLKIGGLCMSLVFMYLEFRANEYWNHFIAQAADIERHLGFKQYSTRPLRRIRTSPLILTFFAAIAVYWLFALLAPWLWPRLI